MILNECRHTRKLAQALCQRNQAEQSRRSDRQRPQRVDPASSDPDPRKNSLLRRYPVVELDTIVSVVETRMEWLGLALGAAVELEVLTPHYDAWLPTAGLKVDAGNVVLNSSWLETFSLLTQLAPLPNEQKS